VTPTQVPGRMAGGMQRATQDARRLLDTIAAHHVAWCFAIPESQQGRLVTGDELRERHGVPPDCRQRRLLPRERVQATADAGEDGLA